MALILADRVQETCNSPGTGTVTLLGAQTCFRSFLAGVGNGNTTYYVIADQIGANWEVGLGTYSSSGNTFARNTVLSSSNAGALTNFSSGTQNIWVDYPASKAVFQDTYGLVTVPTFATSSTTSTTPVLSFNGANTPFASGATVSGNYLQVLLQNKSGTAVASTNYVLSNDLGTDSTYYGEFGMNSSVFSASTPADFFSINNGVYFSGHDGDISIGSGNGFKTYLAWGTTGQSAHVINASGALGFSTNLGTTPTLSGTTGYGTAGQVPVSAGSAGAVAWSSTPTLTGTNFTGIPISTGISGLGTGIATWLTTPSSANLLAAMTDKTGTGSLVFATSPSLTTPLLGTPQSGNFSTGTFTWPTFNQNTTGQSGSVANSVTFNNGGAGAASGTTFNGSTAQTISYNTIGASPLAGSTSLTTLGTVTAGTWNASVIGATYGGTGVNNGANTLTLSGSYTLNQSVASGASPTFTGTNFSGTANSLNAGLGVNQTWQNLTGSRAIGTTYTNSTGKPIMVVVTPTASASLIGTFNINGASVGFVQFTPTGGGGSSPFFYIIPSGATYSVTNNSNYNLNAWWELR